MTEDENRRRVVHRQIAAYARRASVLRQIHSNKGARAQRASRIYLVATVAVASTVSVVGFMGPDGIARTLAPIVAIPLPLVEGVYNLAVLAILVLTILGLIYRFDERATRHYRSIEILTELIRDLEDAIALDDAGRRKLKSSDLDTVRLRYKGILATLPPNSDEEYLKAKELAQQKKGEAHVELAKARSWVDDGNPARVERSLGNKIAEILSRSPHAEVIAAVRDVLGEHAWVTGGFVRDAVWDRQHGYLLPTPLDDVDVVIFDASSLGRDLERAAEAALDAAGGNVNWSVKNQARMHLVSGDEPYHSIEDAIRHFPETATSVACRLDANGDLHILAPHGLADLFMLRVRPTAGFNADRYASRIARKDWVSLWPRLKVEGPGGSSRSNSPRARVVWSWLERMTRPWKR